MCKTKIALLTLFIFLVLPILNADSSAKATIGRIEKISLPQYNLILPARIDTGAHTCSLHINDYKISLIDNVKYIEFDTHDSNGNKFHIKTKVYKESNIKNTTGNSEKRYVIRENLKMGSVTKEVNINLSNRSDLRYPFLVGRNFLRGHFLVDVSLSHNLGD